MTAISTARSEHWLTFDDGVRVAGCHCGFPADVSDEGWGDSVVAHLLEVGQRLAVAESIRSVRRLEADVALLTAELAAATRTIAGANDWNLEVVKDGEYEPIHVVLHHILNRNKKAGTE